MKVKSESEVTQSCPTPSDPMDCSLPGSSFHGIFPGKSTGVGCHCLLCLLTELRYKIPGCDNRCRCVEQGLAGRRSQRSTCSPLHPGLDHLGGEAACSQLSQRRPAFSWHFLTLQVSSFPFVSSQAWEGKWNVTKRNERGTRGTRKELKEARHAGTLSCEEAGAGAGGLEIKRVLHSSVSGWLVYNKNIWFDFHRIQPMM